MKKATKEHRRTSSRKRVAYFRGMLLQKRRLLENRLAALLENAERQTERVTTDEWDVAAAELERETSTTAGSMRSEALAQIDRALQRMQNHTYGICEVCGKPIPKARLQVLPYATMCVACKQEEERLKSVSEPLVVAWSEQGAASADEVQPPKHNPSHHGTGGLLEEDVR